MKDLPIRLFKNPEAWEKWLAANHAKSPGIWMRIAKKNSGIASANYQEALDVALCWGWIDGQKLPYDDTSWLQKFTRRGPKSVWSKINTGKAEALIKNGRMQPSGLQAIESAKADGRWESAYQSWGSADIPPELQAGLDKSPKAKAFFETLRGANRYALIYRVQTAKKPDTKAKRVADYIAMLERNETIHGTPKAEAARTKKKRAT